mgnify:CR=1 FL=1
MKMLTLDAFGDRMIELFPKLMREISQYETNSLTEGVITVPQVWVLDFLKDRKTAQMNELAEYMKLKFSSATGLIDRMVKHQLVKRVRSEADRRVVLISITSKGEKILREIYKQKRKGIMQLFGRLGPEDRMQYMELIEKLVKDLSSTSFQENRYADRHH